MQMLADTVQLGKDAGEQGGPRIYHKTNHNNCSDGNLVRPVGEEHVYRGYFIWDCES